MKGLEDETSIWWENGKRQRTGRVRYRKKKNVETEGEEKTRRTGMYENEWV